MLLSQSLLDQILKLANEAGKHLARFYQQDVKIQTKSDNTPVTEADLFVSQFLIEKLTALCRHCEFRKLCYGGCPKHRFVSLENEPNPHNYLCASYRYFFEQTAPYMQAMARQIRLHPSAA